MFLRNFLTLSIVEQRERSSIRIPFPVKMVTKDFLWKCCVVGVRWALGKGSPFDFISRGSICHCVVTVLFEVTIYLRTFVVWIHSKRFTNYGVPLRYLFSYVYMWAVICQLLSLYFTFSCNKIRNIIFYSNFHLYDWWWLLKLDVEGTRYM